VAKKILLADDSLTIQKVVELTFSDSEYDLLCVPNGQRALEKVAEEAPDLILADVVMPEKNGYEVCEAIKANPATARIPVILLSGTFEPFDRDRAERLGCDAIVSKPFDSQQLLRQVEALLSRVPEEVPSNATMAIPIMANPQPPAAATTVVVPERAHAEPNFAEDDFTASVRVPQKVDGGPDLFEEEYGQADVESAIAAFEKAHPEFSHAEESATRGGHGHRRVDRGRAAAEGPTAKRLRGRAREAGSARTRRATEGADRIRTGSRARALLGTSTVRSRTGTRSCSDSVRRRRLASRHSTVPSADCAPTRHDPADPALRGLRLTLPRFRRRSHRRRGPGHRSDAARDSRGGAVSGGIGRSVPRGAGPRSGLPRDRAPRRDDLDRAAQGDAVLGFAARRRPERRRDRSPGLASGRAALGEDVREIAWK
jgi:CheY-like chemotaxis protein